MAIPVRNKLVTDLLIYLENQPESDTEADRLHSELLADETEATYKDLKAEGKIGEGVTKTKGGSYII